MEEILTKLNKLIKNEHGSKVTIDSMWADAKVDSFGTTVIFLDLDEEYKCFDKEWFDTTLRSGREKLTIKDIVERIQHESA